MESSFSPRETVSELDKFIIGQKNAKRAVALQKHTKPLQIQKGKKKQ